MYLILEQILKDTKPKEIPVPLGQIISCSKFVFTLRGYGSNFETLLTSRITERLYDIRPKKQLFTH